MDEDQQEHGDESTAPADRKTLVLGMLEEAEQFYRDEVEPVQAQATDYYLARPFGNEEKGRSKVISTDVRDTVQAILPSMMRIVFGPEEVVEFRPRRKEDVPVAAQQTDYLNFILREDNPGFMVLHGWIKDAFIRKLGIVKWEWEDRTRVETSEHTGITQEGMGVLAEEGEVEILGVFPQETTAAQQDLVLYDVRLTRRITEGRLRLHNIPNDEFWFNPSARSLETATFVAHVREMPAHEIVAMGVDAALVDSVKGKARTGAYATALADARSIDEGARNNLEDEQDDETRPVEYAECYVLLEDEGEVQLRQVCIIGREHIVFDEAVDERPFALYCPDPEPHTLIGQSVADYTMDVQLIKSAIQRGMLDSLNLTLHPRVEFVEGQVRLDDLLNPEVGGLVRVRAPGMLKESVHSFVGKEAMPVLAYMDDVKENRMGISKAAAGLDADALQSSTKAAVAATITAAQQHIEMLVRVFAETGLKQLFRGMLRCVVRNQDHRRLVRLRNEYVEVDPRHWDADMDVTVNVALGAGTSEEKLRTLGVIATVQQQLLQMPQQPLVGYAELRRTLARMCELSGWKNADEFYKEFTREQEAEMQQRAAQQPPPPDPTREALQAQLQVEMQKLQVQQAKAQQDVQLAQMKMQMEDDRERDRMAREFSLKQQELEMTYGIKVQSAKIDADVAREKAAMDIDGKQRAKAMELLARPAEPPAPRKKRVRFQRDATGRVAAAEVEEQEE
jgi:hypothetical protein